MNLHKIKSIAFSLLILLAVGCDPIEDRLELTNSFHPDDIELVVEQSTTGGNGLTIKMNTPGVTGYWDYNIGRKFSDVVEVNYPIPGKSTFTYHVTTPYMLEGNPGEVAYLYKTIDVQIDKLDQPLPDAYYALIGEDLGGKTWKFAGKGSDGGNWWYMCPANDPSKWQEIWWNAGGDCCPPSDADGRMTFDLNGGANYTYLSTVGGTPVEGGSFSFNVDYSKLTVSLNTGNDKDPNILGCAFDAPAGEQRGNPAGEYHIISLTNDEMILYAATNGGGTGWIWKFVPVTE